MENNDYYLEQRDKLLRNHRQMMAIGETMLTEKIDADFANQAIAHVTAEFDQLIPEIPYIGGKQHPMTDTLVQMTSMLALYRAIKDHLPLEENGDLTYEITVAWIERFPQLLRHLIGRYYMSGFMRQRKLKQASQSQKREYAGDFVYEVVADDSETYTWGINYLECAVVKFFAAQGADKFTPYMCRLDFLMFPAMGITLQRSGTVARGCDYCDFRFKWGGKNAAKESTGLLETE